MLWIVGNNGCSRGLLFLLLYVALTTQLLASAHTSDRKTAKDHLPWTANEPVRQKTGSPADSLHIQLLRGGGGTNLQQRQLRNTITLSGEEITARTEPPSTEMPGPIIVPLLPYGISNQILAMKEIMGLSAILHWTVITFGFWPHMSEIQAAGVPYPSKSEQELSQASSNGSQAFANNLSSRRHLRQTAFNVPTIPFDLIFNRTALAPEVRVLTIQEAHRLYGWTGQLDALVGIHGPGMSQTLQKATSAGLLDASRLVTMRYPEFSCDNAHLDRLAKMVRDHRWVALYAYRHIVPAARNSFRNFAQDPSPCARAYQMVSQRLGKSTFVTDAALDFVNAAFTSGQQQQQPFGKAPSGSMTPFYIALHVRPYPDTCLDYFANMTSYDFDTAAQVCRNPRLLQNMIPNVQRLLASMDDSAKDVALFIMTHPRIQDVVRRELRRLWPLWGPSKSNRRSAMTGVPLETDVAVISGQTAAHNTLPLPRMFSMSVADLPAALRHEMGPYSLLSMVEQEICRVAPAFLGSHSSSISVLIAQERMAADAVEAAEVGSHASGRIMSSGVLSAIANNGSEQEGSARRLTFLF